MRSFSSIIGVAAFFLLVTGACGSSTAHAVEASAKVKARLLDLLKSESEIVENAFLWVETKERLTCIQHSVESDESVYRGPGRVISITVPCVSANKEDNRGMKIRFSFAGGDGKEELKTIGFERYKPY